MTNLKEAKKKYKGEWLAFLVEKVLEAGVPAGRIIAHNKDKRELHKLLRRKKVKNAYITFAGPLLKPGYAVMFLCR